MIPSTDARPAAPRPMGGRTRAVRAALLAAALVTAACAPEVGSDRWCEQMSAKPKGEWTANEAGDFAKHCVLGLKPGN